MAQVLSTAPQQADAELLDRLRRLESDGALRHLRLSVRDASGETVLDTADATVPDPAWRRFGEARDVSHEAVRWSLVRPAGDPWQVTLVPSPESERREAIASAAESTAMLALLAAGTLGAVAWSVHRSLRPLKAMCLAIARIEQQDRDSLRRLPAMPVAELESIAAALRNMATALDDAQARQRLLGQQVLTLQEDERQRLARELHDEFGQRLTAIRVDAAWLARRVEGLSIPGPDLAPVVAGIGQQCERIQQDIRELLGRLSPLESVGETTTLRQLAGRLESLVAAWQRAGDGPVVRLHVDAVDGSGREVDAATAAALALPAPVALAVYRISQEALTNVARHARARTALLSLRARVASGSLRGLDWAVEDDGVGIDALETALRRGSGLAGVHERVWALGADLRCEPVQPGASERRGLRLAASLDATPRTDAVS
jgi:two-component system sensor histidine kinase UhpB